VFFEGGFSGPTVNFTQFIQQPVFNTITVNTDRGGSGRRHGVDGWLEAALRRPQRVRASGPQQDPVHQPALQKHGYGRETESLMIMVTPRIIINEEEEIKQTGVISTPQQQ